MDKDLCGLWQMLQDFFHAGLGAKRQGVHIYMQDTMGQTWRLCASANKKLLGAFML